MHGRHERDKHGQPAGWIFLSAAVIAAITAILTLVSVPGSARAGYYPARPAQLRPPLLRGFRLPAPQGAALSRIAYRQHVMPPALRVVPEIPPQPPGFDAEVASYAKDFLGAPYAWAGTGPAYDCSGLVMTVFAHFGKTLEHSAEWDYQNGTPVSDPVPGDLAVFLSGGYAYHVGIYEGDGMMISALDYSSGVALTPLSWGGPDYAFVAF